MSSANEFKIAVLLPTRGRTTALKISVVSLFNRTLNTDSVQLILGFDNDDEIGLRYFSTDVQPWLEQKGVPYTVMLFEPLGYEGLNQYYNGLGAQASADWLFVWNDDAVMETTGWDKIITDHDGEFKLLKVHTHGEHPYSIFPIYPKEWYDLFKFLSRHQMVDAELSQIAYLLDLIEIVEIYVTHDRADLTGNNNDTTQKKKVTYEGNPSHPLDFHNQMFSNNRIIDATYIAKHLKATGRDITWWENVIAGTQDPWVKMRANDVNKFMVHSQ